MSAIPRLCWPASLSAHYFDSESWYYNDPLDETLLASCASYKAFERYVSGQDLLLLPRSPKELESILRRYAHDAIHNTIAQARGGPLRTGGYSRVRSNLSDPKSVRRLTLPRPFPDVLVGGKIHQRRSQHRQQHPNPSRPPQVSERTR